MNPATATPPVPAPSTVRAGTPRARDAWEDWDAFLARTPAAGFMQTSWWADFRVSAGYEYFGAVLRHDGEVLGGALVHRYERTPGRCFYYIPEGPVLPDDPDAAAQVYAAVMDFVDTRRARDAARVSHLRIEPRWEGRPAFVEGFVERPPLADAYTEPRDTVCVDLRCTDDELLARMKPKGRYNIGLAQRHGVRVRRDDSPAGLAAFLGIYENTAERQHFAAKPSDYFGDLLPELVARNAGTLFIADLDATPIAAALVVHFGERATYFFGGSLAEHRAAMAPYLLHFDAMRHARRLGYAWYDFWGVAPVGARGHPWDAISVFKRKFGTREVSLVPTMDRVYDPTAYDEYRGTGA